MAFWHIYKAGHRIVAYLKAIFFSRDCLTSIIIMSLWEVENYPPIRFFDFWLIFFVGIANRTFEREFFYLPGLFSM